MIEKVTKAFIFIMTTVIAVLLMVMLLQYGILSGQRVRIADIPLELEEYQRISADCKGAEWEYVRIIDTKRDEAATEKELGIDIRDGTDYGHYSLLISKGNEVDHLFMSLWNHPLQYTGIEKYKNIAMCSVKYGRKYDNTYIVYCIRQKNITLEW